MSKDIVHAVQSRVNIAEIISEYIDLKQRGDSFVALCPFHNDKKTASLSVSASKGLFYCFGCQKGGNVFHFLMQYKRITFYDALCELGKRVGIDVQKDKTDKHSFITDIFSKTKDCYEKALANSTKAKDYLAKRKIQNAIHTFNLGYAPAVYSSFLLKELGGLFNLEELCKSDIIRRGKDSSVYDYFRDRIIFPIFNEYDKIIAFGGRVINDGEPKYLNSKENYYFKKSETLYGLNKAKQSMMREGVVIIVEGYFDVIMASQLGIENVVAPLGTAITEKHINKIKRYCPRMVLAFDGDSAGNKAINKSLMLSLTYDMDVNVFALPKNTDPFDYLLQFGKDKFIEEIKNAQNAFEYYIEYELSKINKDSDFEKRRYLTTIYSTIKLTTSEVQKELYLNKLAATLKISTKSIYDDFDKSSRPQKQRNYKENGNDKVRQENTIELYLIFVILNNIDLFGRYKSKIKVNLFKDAFAKKLFFKLSELYADEEEAVIIDSLLDSLTDEKERSVVFKSLVEQSEYNTNAPIKAIKDCISNIQLRDRKENAKLISKKLEVAVRNDEDTNKLLEEQQFLMNEIQKLTRNVN